MRVVRVFLAVPAAAVDSAKKALEQAEFDVHETPSATFDVDGMCDTVLSVAAVARYSSLAARGVPADVYQALLDSGIPFERIAVDPRPLTFDSQKKFDIVPIPNINGRRRFKPRTLGLGPSVFASTEAEADVRRRELDKIRNVWPSLAPTEKVVRRRDRAAASRAASARHPRADLIALLVVICAAVGVGVVGYSISALTVSGALLLGVFGTIFVMRTAAIEALGTATTFVLYVGVPAALSFAVRMLVGAAAALPSKWVLATIVVFALAPGLYIQLRVWNVSRVLAGAVPVVATVTTGLAPVVGFLTYWQYSSSLGLPYDLLMTTTGERIWAGLPPMVLAFVVMCFMIALLGFAQWFNGRNKSTDIVAVFFLVLALFASVAQSLDKATAAATTNSKMPGAWYGLRPVKACITAISDAMPAFGPEIEYNHPHILLGVSDELGSRAWVIWDGPKRWWLLPTEATSVMVVETSVTTCG